MKILPVFVLCLLASSITLAQGGVLSQANVKNLPDPCGMHNSGLRTADCNRATPVAMFNDSVFNNSKFMLTRDSLMGYSQAILKNGDKLLVVDCGCTDFTMTFMFTTTRYNSDTSNMKYWYGVTANLLKEFLPGMYGAAPFNFKKSADTLESMLRGPSDSLKLNRVIYFYSSGDGDTSPEMQAMLPHFYINRIHKVSAEEYGVEITYTVSLD